MTIIVLHGHLKLEALIKYLTGKFSGQTDWTVYISSLQELQKVNFSLTFFIWKEAIDQHKFTK